MLLKVFPGVGVTLIFAILAFFISSYSPFIDPLIMGLVLGVIFRSLVGNREVLNPGYEFITMVCIPVGIILYGLKLDFLKLIEVGGLGIFVAIGSMVIFFTIIFILGKALGLSEKTTILTASGSAICGASAIAILSPVVEAEHKDVSASIVAILIASSIGVFLIYLFKSFFEFSVPTYSYLTGATLHMTGQVRTASTFLEGSTPLAMAVKMVRVAMLAPIALFLAIRQRQINKRLYGEESPYRFPWFIIVFIIVGIISSSGLLKAIPKEVLKLVSEVGTFIFTLALTAIGLQVDFRSAFYAGIKPTIVALVGWIGATMFVLLVATIL